MTIGCVTPDSRRHKFGRGQSRLSANRPAVYREMVRLFHQNGVPVGTHAVGDRAMDWVVDTYALVEQEQPHSGLRHSIIHANLPTPHALDAMADSAEETTTLATRKCSLDSFGGSATSTPPVMVPNAASAWSPLRPYTPRHPLVRRFRLLRHPGCRTLRPLGLHSAPNRQRHLRPATLRAPKVVDIHTALRSYTAWASRQMFLEDKIGTLEVGKEPTSRSGTATSTPSPMSRSKT